MRIWTKTVCVWNDELERYVTDESESEWFEYEGPVTEMKVTKEEKALQQQQAAFYQTLQANYAQQFAKQSAILDSIKATFDPILKAGINQYGFGDAEDKTLRTQASEATARNYEAASKAVEAKFAAQGGGNTFIPSGARAQLETDVAAAAAGDESTKELGITEAGYDLGRRNFEAAANAEAGAARLYDPQSYASNANAAGKEAFDSASTIAQQDDGLWGAIGGILGGGISAFAGGFGTGLSKIMGSGAKPPSGDPSICWIAEALYGADDIRTHLARKYLQSDYSKTRLGAVVVGAYARYGERIAKWVKRSRILRALFRPLFDRAVSNALALSKPTNFTGPEYER